MKRFEEYLQEITNNGKEAHEFEKTADSIMESVPAYNFHMGENEKKERKIKLDAAAEKTAPLYSKSKDIEIVNRILRNNAKIALFEQIKNDLIEVLNKYNSKSIGEKTAEKIKNEMMERCNVRVYINDREITVYPNHERTFNDYNLSLFLNTGNYDNNYFLKGNKLQCEYLNTIYIGYVYNFVENPAERIEQIKQKQIELLQAQEQYNKIISEYNNLVGNAYKHFNTDHQRIN